MNQSAGRRFVAKKDRRKRAGIAADRIGRALVLALMVAALGGWQWPRLPEVSASETASPQEEGNPQPSRFTRAAGETWDVLKIGSKKVGSQSTSIRPLVRNGRPLVEIRSTQRLSITRFEQTTEQSLESVWLETPAGELVEFETTERTGRERTRTQAVVRDKKILFTVETTGKSERSEMEWPDPQAGWYRVEHRLANEPLRPGERRELRVLMPIVNQVASVELQAIEVETTNLLDQPRELLRIHRKDRLGSTELVSVAWMDAAGAILKTLVPGLGLETHRATREIAESSKDRGGFDLGAATVVKLDRPLTAPHLREKVVYRATLDGNSAERIFAEGASQSVRPINDRQVEITVRALRPSTRLEVDTEPEPTDDDRNANSWIQSDDRRILEMAEQACGDESNAWVAACRLEKYVRSQVRTKSFSQAFLSAAEVARSGEGDCTEHAVLLAALCRARKIPARVAIGLVYYPPATGFAYHMWNEVWVTNRWIPLDATLGNGGIGGGHLKLATSNLKGSDSRAVFLPVSQLLGRLRLELVDASVVPDQPPNRGQGPSPERR